MRFLAIHVDYFSSKITQKGRSKLVEPYDDPVTEVSEALLLLTSVEKDDEAAPEVVADRASDEIARLADSLKVNSLVLHSFAHLFANLSTPEVAVKVMKDVEDRLRTRGFTVIRTPFGYFNTLDIKAKGHPLSRVARIIHPN